MKEIKYSHERMQVEITYVNGVVTTLNFVSPEMFVIINSFADLEKQQMRGLINHLNFLQNQTK